MPSFFQVTCPGCAARMRIQASNTHEVCVPCARCGKEFIARTPATGSGQGLLGDAWDDLPTPQRPVRGLSPPNYSGGPAHRPFTGTVSRHSSNSPSLVWVVSAVLASAVLVMGAVGWWAFSREGGTASAGIPEVASVAHRAGVDEASDDRPQSSSTRSEAASRLSDELVGDEPIGEADWLEGRPDLWSDRPAPDVNELPLDQRVVITFEATERAPDIARELAERLRAKRFSVQTRNQQTRVVIEHAGPLAHVEQAINFGSVTRTDAERREVRVTLSPLLIE